MVVHKYRLIRTKRSTATFLSLLVFSFMFVGAAYAKEPEVKIRDEGYAAKFISQSIADPITIMSGEKKTVVIKFQNAGTATWDEKSAQYISGYTMEPRDRASAFKGVNWKSGKQTGKLKGKVAPGAVGELQIELVAPKEPGEYIEKFYLAAENYTWVMGGYFFLKINVGKSTQITANDANGARMEERAEQNDTLLTSSTTHRGKLIGINKKQVTAKGGERVDLITIYQNLSGEAWNNYRIVPVALADGGGRPISFAGESWASSTVVVEKKDMSVVPDTSAREEFYFRAPAKQGGYLVSFEVEVGGQKVTGARTDIEVNVNEDAPSDYQPPFAPSALVVEEVPRLVAEPRIKVGLWKQPESTVQFVSYEDDYRVYVGAVEKGLLEKNKVGILKFGNGLYSFNGPGSLEFSTPEFIRLEPVNDPHAVFTLLNYQRMVKWKGPANFNKYRGALEYRTTQDGQTVYAMNDVLFDDYVAGIGENANKSNEEYLKAQSVAQRTYAYYIKESTDKHDKRNFDVVATTGDQLYLGYESEKIMPRFVEAAKATRGYMATYEGEVVITPYYGNSSGRTLAWTEVWGGKTKPWLVSVVAHYDKGRRKNGHGVGMSQLDAVYRAENEGMEWRELVKYYYRGVEITKMYN